MKEQLPSLKCKNCNKEYQRQSALDKHRLLCIGGDPLTPPTTLNLDDVVDGLCQLDSQQNEVGGVDDLSKLYSQQSDAWGSPPQLWDIVMELVKSNQKLRKDVEELKRWVHAKKKKVIIVDWLNENYKPHENYKEFMSKLCITRTHLEIVFKSNIIDGIQEILQDYINIAERDESIPLKSFDQKDNEIYVYNEESKWELLSQTNFNTMISALMKSILAEFKNWQDENEKQLYTDDFSVIYIQNVKKVMGGNIPIDKQRNKIHKNLYKYLNKGRHAL